MRLSGEARAAVALPRARRIEEKATMVSVQIGDAWCLSLMDIRDSYISMQALQRTDQHQGSPVNNGYASA